MNEKPIKRAVYREQLATLKVIEEIIELEKTKKFLKKSSSLFEYMTIELRYSAGAAMRRIHAARVVMRFPEVKELLKTRRVSLCTVSMIATELLRTGDRALIEQIVGRSKREVEGALVAQGRKAPLKEQVREIATSPVAPRNDRVFLSPPHTCHREGAERPRRSQTPLPPPPPEPVYRISFTATKETYELMEQVKAGMSHSLVGKEDPIAQIVHAGVQLLKKEVDKKRVRKSPFTQGKEGRGESRVKASGDKPTHSRRVSTELKRAVFEKAGSKCEYVLENGKKCCSTWQLEIDHIRPVALGGKTHLENLRLTCRNHNQYLAREAGLFRPSRSSAGKF